MHRKSRLLAPLVCAAALAMAPAAQAEPNQAAAGINQGNLVSALNNIAVQLDRIEALNDLTVQDVRVVNVEDVLRNARVLNNALRDANVQIVQDSLNDNEVIKQALNQNDVAITDVVAVNVLSGGDVVVFERS